MGYWRLNFERDDGHGLTDADIEHIGEMIKGGFTSGEIVEESED